MTAQPAQPVRDAALLAFVAVTAVDGAVTALRLGTADAWLTGVLAVVVYAALSWLARSGRTVSIWAVVVIMLINATRHLTLGAGEFMAESGHAVEGVLRLAAGGVLTWGALVVFRTRLRRDDHG
jgi:hypothetical protein